MPSKLVLEYSPVNLYDIGVRSVKNIYSDITPDDPSKFNSMVFADNLFEVYGIHRAIEANVMKRLIGK